MKDWMTEQKNLLADKIAKETPKGKKISEENDKFIDFFYQYQELGFAVAWAEFLKYKKFL